MLFRSRHWKENCLKNKDKIIKMFDEKFFRMWEFYLAGCEMALLFEQLVIKNNEIINEIDLINFICRINISFIFICFALKIVSDQYFLT